MGEAVNSIIEQPKNGYVTVERVLKRSYVIPTYQRGYRWDEENVLKLLEDIYEDKLITDGSDPDVVMETIIEKRGEIFNLQDKKIVDACNPYCIQPLVVCRKKDSEQYVVIDGQQRLTTIIIIVKAIKYYCKEKGINDPSSDFSEISLTYDSRIGSDEFLNGLGDGSSNSKNNLDFMYMQQSFNTVYKFLVNKVDIIVPGEKSRYITYLWNILLKNTQFIWYCIDSDAMDPHEVFSNFNSGKLELTNAELIKALFMDKANYSSENIDDKRIVISEKWDEIETALHNPDFWAFVPHRDQYGDGGYDTRIDVIFELFLLSKYVDEVKGEVKVYKDYRKRNNTDRYLFNEIEKWINDELQKASGSKDKNKIMNDCWYAIRKVYLGLLELYEVDTIGDNSNKIYNMTGLLINLMNREDNYVDRYKQDPFLYLEVYYQLFLIMKEPRLNRMEVFRKLIKEQLGIDKTVEEFVKTTKYSDSAEKEGNTKSDIIVKMLLAYNIALLNNSKGIGQRFDFRAFAKIIWQREHIFASNVDETKNEKEGLDTVEERKTALKMLAINISEKDEKDGYKNLYMEYLRNVYFFKESKFPPDIKDKDTGITSEFDLTNEVQVDKFRERFYDTSQRTLNSMLARAIRANQQSKELLFYYDLIEGIENAGKLEGNDRENAIYSILVRVDNIYSKDYIDITKRLDGFLSDYPNGDSYPVNIGKYHIEIVKDNTKDRSDVINDLKDKYSDYVRDLIMEKDPDQSGVGAGSVQYRLKKITDISEWDNLWDILLLCKDTLNSKIDKYFDDDFAKQLSDNSMGNQTLLTGGNGEETENQNQKVSNKSYKLKKKDVREFLKKGQFVPLGTLMVFSDAYNDDAYTSNFWLPDSRLRYINNIIDTLGTFFGEERNS